MDEEGSSPVDLIHANTVESVRWPHLVDSDPIYATGNVIWTSRRQNIVAIVDWESNRLLWSWGQDELLGPHEGRVLASGNILIFDNGTKRTGSRVIEVDPMSREIVWEYRGKSPQDFFTSGRGGAERLANGNTLITESAKGQAFEVTPEGEQVWIFLTPHLTREDHRLTFRRMRHFSRGSIDRILSPQSSH
jgi:integrase